MKNNLNDRQNYFSTDTMWFVFYDVPYFYFDNVDKKKIIKVWQSERIVDPDKYDFRSDIQKKIDETKDLKRKQLRKKFEDQWIYIPEPRKKKKWFWNSDFFTTSIKWMYWNDIMIFWDKLKQQIRIEFSLPKYLFGVNYIPYDDFYSIIKVFHHRFTFEYDTDKSFKDFCIHHKMNRGGFSFLKDIDYETYDVKEAVEYMETLFKENKRYKFPYFDDWHFYRQDIAIEFDLWSQDNVERFFLLAWSLEYPRRETKRYSTSINFPWSSTDINIYNKYAEVVNSKTTRKQFRKIKEYYVSRWMKEEAVDILIEKWQNKAIWIVRLEVQFKQQKLIEIFRNQKRFKKDSINKFKLKDL